MDFAVIGLAVHDLGIFGWTRRGKAGSCASVALTQAILSFVVAPTRLQRISELIGLE